MMASDETREAAEDVMRSSSEEWVGRRQRGRWQCQDFASDGSIVEGTMHKTCDGARGDLDRRAGESVAKGPREEQDCLMEENENLNAELMKVPAETDELSTQDSNSNASHLSTISRPNKTLEPEDKKSLTKISRGGVLGSDKTETMTVLAIACIVLFPYVILWWSNPVAAWPALHMLWRLAFQSVAVAFATGLILIGLQAHFSDNFFSSWASWLFKKEKNEDSQSPVVDDAEQTSGVPSLDEIEGSSNDNIDLALQQKMETEKLNCSHSVASQTEAAEDPAPNTGERAKSYKAAMKKFYRKFLLIRRKCQSEMAGLRRSDQEASAFLARVQMVLPGLERDKQALLAELQAIEKQYEEEKRRNHELLGRLQRLNQHFHRLGQPQSSGATTTTTTAAAAAAAAPVNAQLTDQQVMQTSHHYQPQSQPHVQHQMDLQQQQQQQQQQQHQQQQQQQACKQPSQQQYAHWQIAASQNSPYPKLPFLTPVALATHPSGGPHALQAQGFLQLQPPRPQQHFPHLQVLSQSLTQSPVVQATQQLQQSPVHGNSRNSAQQGGQSQGMRGGLLQPK